MTLDPSRVIKRPIVTERSSMLREAHNKYVFEVFPKVTKNQVKQAVEKVFNVSVLDVNTMMVPSKIKKARVGGKIFETKKANWKKAVVTLGEGQKIELFEGV